MVVLGIWLLGWGGFLKLVWILFSFEDFSLRWGCFFPEFWVPKVLFDFWLFIVVILK